ncbi:MAG: beta-galactosidase [Blautia sp.]|nr:beta-galactosidase [Blautia sp.]
MQNKLLYGAEYYIEYMPYDRLSEDIRLMKEAGINCIRVGESTWSSMEPQEGVFDFSELRRVLDACSEAGISVIAATPTYAIPGWLAQKYPDILAETSSGRLLYGKRQTMDITNADYLFYAERIIRKLMEHTAGHPAVIGYQLDNETGYYDAAGEHIQQLFTVHLRQEFHGDLNRLNQALGLSYWSNRIDSWENIPDLRGAVNESLRAEFDAFRRAEVTRFLAMQAKIVREYLREDQFITHNLSLFWNGDTYGFNPDVDEREIGKIVDVCGIDIYHPAQDDLTGMEIAFGGDLARSVKRKNYLVLETQAQGFPGWLPYDGQLRLQAFSHFASGADMVEYWPWHSIHNGPETFWKGVLGHDLKVNDTYRTVKQIGQELSMLSGHLHHLKKKNRTAFVICSRSRKGLDYFPMNISAGEDKSIGYNDVLKKIYRQLYFLNVECDFVWPDSESLEEYDLLIVPALYVAEDIFTKRLSDYVRKGGHLLGTFKTAFADKYLKVYHDGHPHGLRDCFGMSYSNFTLSRGAALLGNGTAVKKEGRRVTGFMELLEPADAQVLASYDHPAWKKYAAVTENVYGSGTAWYLGCDCEDGVIRDLLIYILSACGLYKEGQEEFPVIVRRGKNMLDKEIRYFLNFSGKEQRVHPDWQDGLELLSQTRSGKGTDLLLPPWGVKIIETDGNS